MITEPNDAQLLSYIDAIQRTITRELNSIRDHTPTQDKELDARMEFLKKIVLVYGRKK